MSETALSVAAEQYAKALLKAWESEAISQSVIITVQQGGHGLNASSTHLPDALQPSMGVLRELQVAGLIYLGVWTQYGDSSGVQEKAPFTVEYEMTLLAALKKALGSTSFVDIW